MPFKTYNDVEIPDFMYGTAWKKEKTTELVRTALSAGYRAIDTANQLVHYDEARVGEALQQVYEKEWAKRDSLFIQTKFTSGDGQRGNTPYDAKADLTTQVKQSFESSLKHLHTDYLDSYVLHGPYTRDGLSAADWEVWAAIESLYESGKTRMIGVSNISDEQLLLLCAKAKVKPMLVQNRCYAAMGWDSEVRAICREQNIVYQGFSLLTANQRQIMEPEIQKIARRLNAGLPQLIFRFCLQMQMQVLTGTTSRSHMIENLQNTSFELSDEELKTIEMIGLVKGYF